MKTKNSFTTRLEQAGLLVALLSSGLSACSSLPTPKYSAHPFPKEDAFLGEPDASRPYEKIGLLRAKVNFQSLNPDREEAALCRNYYNKAVNDLLKMAKKKGGDAVIHVKSVVQLIDGRMETHSTPECADEGEEGQALVQGIAIKWKKIDPED